VTVQSVPGIVLGLLGAGFLLADVRLLAEYVTFLRRRRAALLTWPGPRPPHYGLALTIGAVMGALALYKLIVLRRQVFGESMMFLYYGYFLPLSRRIGRGFYAEGIWADASFIRYDEVGGISWRESEHQVTLVVISKLRNLARRLTVPAEHYGAARRLLRDKIAASDIHFAGTGLDLGAHDEREDV
jgi:hypothetical protein